MRNIWVEKGKWENKGNTAQKRLATLHAIC